LAFAGVRFRLAGATNAHRKLLSKTP